MLALLATAPGVLMAAGLYLSLAPLVRFLVLLPHLASVIGFQPDGRIPTRDLSDNIVKFLSAATGFPPTLVSALWEFVGRKVPLGLGVDPSTLRALFNKEGLVLGLSKHPFSVGQCLSPNSSTYLLRLPKSSPPCHHLPQ